MDEERNAETATPPAGAGNGDGTPTAKRNARPADVTSLLIDADLGDLWFANNRKKNRFYVVNIERVLGEMDFPHTTAKTYFTKAKDLIAAQTEWPRQQPFHYECSHTQIYPELRQAAKDFGRAATIIVALEIAAADLKPKLNVYDFLRILPAQFFLERLTRQRLAELKSHYDGMDQKERSEAFGPDAGRPFAELCLQRLDQVHSDRLLEQLAEGHTVTLPVAARLKDFVSDHFPAHLHLGDVLSAGAEGADRKLGTKNASPALRVSKSFDTATFPDCV